MAGVRQPRHLPGHTFQGVTISDNSRTHLGNVYTNYQSPADERDGESWRLPEHWAEAVSDERRYYVDFDAHKTTWVRPSPDLTSGNANLRAKLETEFKAILKPEKKDGSSPSSSENATGAEPRFYQATGIRAKELDVLWPDSMSEPCESTNQGITHCRCSIFTKGESIVVDGDQPLQAIQKIVGELSKRDDCVWIIENINDEWIQALGETNALDLPAEFFIGHASPRERKPAMQNASISSMDDIIERALSLERSLGKKKEDESVKEVIEALWGMSLIVKKSVESWGLCDVSTEELDRVASCVAECEQILTRLGIEIKTASNSSKQLDSANVASVRALHRQMRDLDFLRYRRYFNLYATYEYEEHIPADLPVRSPQNMFFKRETQRREDEQTLSFSATEADPQGLRHSHIYGLDTQISYIRVDKTLCTPHTKDFRPTRSLLMICRPDTR